jgi:Zn-dependent protease with chaperone function
MRIPRALRWQREPAAARRGARRLLTRCVVLLLGAALACGIRTPAQGVTFPSTADEVRFGAQTAKQIDSHYLIVTDPVLNDRINRVGAVMAGVVERQDLKYHFEIVSTPVVSSFGVPGGWVYVTAGMIQFVRTDDELAAVLAHELAHINHHDYYIEQDRMSHLTGGYLLALALSVLSQSPAPLAGVQMIAQGALTSYQRDLEEDADLAAVSYLAKTSYSPVAMLTVLEHVMQIERLSGQTGPQIRAEYVRLNLEQLHIPIIRRVPEGYLRITLDPAAPAGAQPVTIRVDGRPVLTLGAAVDGKTPAQRAEAIVAKLNAFFDRDPAPYDVRTTTLLGRASVVAETGELYAVAPEDAAYAHMDASALAQDVRSQLAQAIDAAPYNRRF